MTPLVPKPFISLGKEPHMRKLLLTSLGLMLMVAVAGVTSAATPTPSWTPTLTATQTKSPTPTTTPTVTATPTMYAGANDSIQPNWERPSLSRKGGRVTDGSFISFGDEPEDDRAGWGGSYHRSSQVAGCITQGDAVALVVDGVAQNTVILTSSIVDPNFIGIAANTQCYDYGRVYVQIGGYIKAKVGQTVAAGDALVCTSSGYMTKTAAIALTTPGVVPTATSNLKRATVQEPRTGSGLTKVRLQ